MTPESNLPPAGGPPPPSSPVNAQEQLNVPSILILVGGALGILGGLLGILGGGARAMMMAAQNNPDMARYAPYMAGGGIAGSIFRIAFSAFLVYGALQMRSLKGYGIAMATAICAIVPCSCYCITIPAGIWALVILMKPEVKAQFTA